MTRHLSNQFKRTIPKVALAFLTGLLFWVGISLPAGAQELSVPDPRQGYFIGVGGMAGIGGIHTDDTKWVAPMGGPLGTLHVGQGLNDALAIGIHMGAGMLYSKGRKTVLGNFSLELKWSFYRDLFIRPSIGFGFVDVTRTDYDKKKILADVGASYHVAVGYDFFPFHDEGESGGIGFTPVAWINASNGTHTTTLAGGIGIEITFHAGLPKNQLKLTDANAYSGE